MNIAKMLVAAGGLALLAAGPAAAQGYYLRGDVGVSISDGTKGDILTGNGWGQDFGTTAVIGAGAGMYIPLEGWPFKLRADLTGSYRPGFSANHSGSNPVLTLSAKTDVDVAAVMATIYADIPTGTPFTPYIGFGIGVGITSLSTVNYNFNGVRGATEGGDTTANFAWSAGIGFTYPLSAPLLLDVGYRYFDAGDVKTTGRIQVVGRPGPDTQPPLKGDLSAHEITIGLRYNF